MGRRLLRAKTRLHECERTRYSDHLTAALDIAALVRFAAGMLPLASCVCMDATCTTCQAAEVVARVTRRQPTPPSSEPPAF